MSIKKEFLRKLLEQADLKPEFHIREKLTEQAVSKAGLTEKVLEVYHYLGGTNSNHSFYTTLTYDFHINGTYLMFDEELHFNRYRNITLRSSIYESLPDIKTDNFRRYGRQYEKECLKAGMKSNLWSNSFSEKLFGPSAEAGDFFGNGSAEWKLRAFHDFLLDVTSFVKKAPLMRIAIYDNVMIEGQLIRFDKALTSKNPQTQEMLLNYIKRILKVSNE